MSESPSPTPRKLTPKQELFIIEYAKDFNATQAAIRAGYKGKYIDRTAHELLEKTRDLIEERKRIALQKAENQQTAIDQRILAVATLEQSLAMATALAFYDPRKLYNEFGARKDMSRLTRRQALCVVDVGAETDMYRTIDRAPYLNMLLKWHGAFPAKKAEPVQAQADSLIAQSFSLADRMALRAELAAVIQRRLAPKANGTHG